MSSSTDLNLHQDVTTVDIPAIVAAYQGDVAAASECECMLEEGLARIRHNPRNTGKTCKFEPLKAYRSLKVFSSAKKRTARHARPDMRIIYQYDETADVVTVYAMGFRKPALPRPDDDPYSRAGTRI